MSSKGFTTPQRVCVTCYAMITHKNAKHQQMIQNHNYPPHHHHHDLYDADSGASPPLSGHLDRYYGSNASGLHSTASLGGPQFHSMQGSGGNGGSGGGSGGGGSQSFRGGSVSSSFAGNMGSNGGIDAIGNFRGISKEKVETYMLQAQVTELRHLVGAMQKQIESLAGTNMSMQQQILEQEELKAETMLLITQLMTRVSVLELQSDNDRKGDDFNL